MSISSRENEEIVNEVPKPFTPEDTRRNDLYQIAKKALDKMINEKEATIKDISDAMNFIETAKANGVPGEKIEPLYRSFEEYKVPKVYAAIQKVIRDAKTNLAILNINLEAAFNEAANLYKLPQVMLDEIKRNLEKTFEERDNLRKKIRRSQEAQYEDYIPEHPHAMKIKIDSSYIHSLFNAIDRAKRDYAFKFTYFIWDGIRIDVYEDYTIEEILTSYDIRARQAGKESHYAGNRFET